ncbi:MAG: winged helix-turn-helix transcriptional regulator [Deltaproteobacteria bacterium]|nr:winged helix-turn-helix transcriptional regulator [Deltaproteobacteria bacterium]
MLKPNLGNDERERIAEVAELLGNAASIEQCAVKLFGHEITLGVVVAVGLVARRELQGDREDWQPLTMTELTDERGRSSAAATGVADRAVKFGLLERVGLVDRRKNGLRVTAKGWELLGLSAEALRDTDSES